MELVAEAAGEAAAEAEVDRGNPAADRIRNCNRQRWMGNCVILAIVVVAAVIEVIDLKLDILGLTVLDSQIQGVSSID